MRTFFLLGVLVVLLFVAVQCALHPVAMSAPSSQWSLVGRPSLSAPFMDEVLAAYHSPAVGLGSVLYADGVPSHLDPAFALAFFWHESTFGTQGIARSTHSLGNIRCTVGYPSCLDGFRSSPSWAAGAADWFHLMTSVYLPAGRSTVPAVVTLYTPSSENDTQAYIFAVEHVVSTWRAGRVLV